MDELPFTKRKSPLEQDELSINQRNFSFSTPLIILILYLSM